jgi:hypothetical protein
MFLSRRISMPFTGKREIAADRLRNAGRHYDAQWRFGGLDAASAGWLL